jgi:hypothetical protein
MCGSCPLKRNESSAPINCVGVPIGVAPTHSFVRMEVVHMTYVSRQVCELRARVVYITRCISCIFCYVSEIADKIMYTGPETWRE